MSLWKPKYKDSNGNIQDLQIAANCLTDGTHLVKLPTLTADKTIAVTSDLNNYLPLSGGTLSGNLIIKAPHRDTYYASNVCRHFYSGTPTQFVIKTKIRFVSGTHMPVIRIYGYAYGEQSPIELRVGFYIYNDTLGWAGAVSTGAWKPEVYLFKYTADSKDYVAVGFKGACYFCGFQVDCQIGASGSFGDLLSMDGWSTTHNGADTSQSIIPAIGTDKCVQVSYKTMKTDISGTAGNASKLNNQEASYYLNYNNFTNTPTIPTSFILVDDILDGSANKYAPYSSKGAGHFYTGTTDPSSTNRLNYDGYLYASRLYSTGSVVADGSIVANSGVLANDYSTYGSEDLTNSYVIYDDSDDAYETRYGLRKIRNVTENGTYTLSIPEKTGTIATMTDVNDTLVEIVDLTTLA